MYTEITIKFVFSGTPGKVESKVTSLYDILDEAGFTPAKFVPYKWGNFETIEAAEAAGHDMSKYKQEEDE